MYFLMMRWLIGLALVLTLIYIYPLVDNLRSRGWTADYQLVIPANQVCTREAPTQMTRPWPSLAN